MIRLVDEEASAAFGERIAALAQPGDVVTLAGPLGAGKTSIARGLLSALGLEAEAPSPTFAIVQPYAPPEVRLPVLHVDLYRIEGTADLAELGLDEARAESLLVIEWPERGGDWGDALALTLTIETDNARALTARVPPAWEARWRSM